MNAKSRTIRTNPRNAIRAVSSFVQSVLTGQRHLNQRQYASCVAMLLSILLAEDYSVLSVSPTTYLVVHSKVIVAVHGVQ
jgi:hypothetical protein